MYLFRIGYHTFGSPDFSSPVNGAVCGRLHYIYTELPRDVRGVVTIDTFVTFFKIRQVRQS